MLLNLLLLCFIIFPLFLVGQSNYLIDPDFETGAPSVSECKAYSVYHFNIAKTGWSIKFGTPDLMTPSYNSCTDNHFIKPARKIKNQCLGLALTAYTPSYGHRNKEGVYTRLNASLNINEKYFFGTDYIENLNNFGRADLSVSPFVLILFSDTLDSSDTIQLDLKLLNSPEWNKAFSFFIPSQSYNFIAIELNPNFYLSDSLEYHRFYYFIDNVVLAPAIEVEEIKPTPVSRADTFKLFFDHNQFSLGIQQKADLKLVLDSQSPLNYDSIVIVGHTDTVGTFEYNFPLSLQRAQIIKEKVREQWGNSIPITIKARSFSDFETVGEGDLARRSDVYFYKNLEAVLPWYRVSSRINQSLQWMYLGKIEEGLAANGVRESFSVPDLDITLTSQQIDAIRLISRRAQDVRVLIVNENHHDPYHRFFIAELLEDLHDHGYRHLAVEGLYDSKNLHTSIKDPIFLDYLRKARDMGFYLYRYDVDIDTLPDVELDVQQIVGETTYAEGFDNISKRMNKRDYYQYIGIKRILNDIPEDEKLIIHVGHGHGKTRQSGEWKPLGAWLKEDLGDQLLSIDQATLNECVYPDQNDYNKHYNNQKSIVPYTSRGPYVRREFNLLTFRNEEFYDLSVLHPIKRNRDFRTEPSKEISFSIEEFESDCPCMALVYFREDDPLHATAFSVQEIDSSDPNITVLLLRDYPSRLIVKCVEERVIVDDDFE